MREYVFLSYRRSDSAGTAGRIRERLVQTFGPDSAFMDVEDIAGAEAFGPKLLRKVQGAAATLVLIGPGWLSASQDDRRRLDDPADHTRREIETALNSQTTVVPVLLDNAPMPRADELPASLAKLAEFNAVEVRNGASFSDDMARLAATLRRISPDLVPPAASTSQARNGSALRWAGIGAGILVAALIAGNALRATGDTATPPPSEPIAEAIGPAERAPSSPAPARPTVSRADPAPSPPRDAQPAAPAAPSTSTARHDVPAPPPPTASPEFAISNARLISLRTYNDGNVTSQITFRFTIRNRSDREIFVSPILGQVPASFTFDNGAELTSRTSSAELGMPVCYERDSARCAPNLQTAIPPGETFSASVKLGGFVLAAQSLDRAALEKGLFTVRVFATDRGAFGKEIPFSAADVPVNITGFRP